EAGARRRDPQPPASAGRLRVPHPLPARRAALPRRTATATEAPRRRHGELPLPIGRDASARALKENLDVPATQELGKRRDRSDDSRAAGKAYVRGGDTPQPSGAADHKPSDQPDGNDWLEAELADTLDEDYELELSEPALSVELRKIYQKKPPPSIPRVE